MENTVDSVLEQAKELLTKYQPNDEVFLICDNVLVTGRFISLSIQIKNGLQKFRSKELFTDIINVEFEVLAKEKNGEQCITYTSHVAKTKEELIKMIDKTNNSNQQTSQNAEIKENQP